MRGHKQRGLSLSPKRKGLCLGVELLTPLTKRGALAPHTALPSEAACSTHLRASVYGISLAPYASSGSGVPMGVAACSTHLSPPLF